MRDLSNKIDIFVLLATQALRKAKKKALVRRAGGWWEETEEERIQKETAEKEKIANRAKKNAEVWAKVETWFKQFGDPDLEYDRDNMKEYNPEYASEPVRKMTGIYSLPEGVKFTVDAQVDRNIGDCVIRNVRAIYSGKNAPEFFKQKIHTATGKQVQYHKPTNAWVYDAQINGGLKLGDPKMIMIAKKLGE